MATSATTTPNGINVLNGSAAPAPTSAIDWDAVGFKVHKVNGHAHVTWSNGKWGKVEFRSEEMLQIHGFASCLNYGQVCLTALLVELMGSNVLRG